MKTGEASRVQAKKEWPSLETFESGSPRTSRFLDFSDETLLKVTPTCLIWGSIVSVKYP